MNLLAHQVQEGLQLSDSWNLRIHEPVSKPTGKELACR
jgi:hypothetical protein